MITSAPSRANARATAPPVQFGAPTAGGPDRSVADLPGIEHVAALPMVVAATLVLSASRDLRRRRGCTLRTSSEPQEARKRSTVTRGRNRARSPLVPALSKGAAPIPEGT